MTALVPILLAGLAAPPPPDPIAACLDAVMLASGRLVAATINGNKVAIEQAMAEALRAHAAALSRRDDLVVALAPASEGEIQDEGLRLLRAWPQDRRSDLAGYGAELRIFLSERRPSLRALQQACRTLKLTKVHLPAIAEVIGAIDQIEASLQARVRIVSELPARIARAEAVLAPKPPRTSAPVPGGAP